MMISSFARNTFCSMKIHIQSKSNYQ